MLSRAFICQENPDFDENGWRPKWQPSFDAYSGIAVPHDIMEHLPGDDGGAEGEFMAMGAAWVIRGSNGWFQRSGNINPTEVHLASDMPQIFERIREGRQTIKDPGTTYRIRDSNDEDMVQAIVAESWKGIRREHEWLDEHHPGALDDLLSNTNRARLTGWLRRGVCAARERYRNTCTATLAHMFTRIAERADDLLRNAYIGDELHVSINLRMLNVEVWIPSSGTLDNW